MIKRIFILFVLKRHFDTPQRSFWMFNTEWGDDACRDACSEACRDASLFAVKPSVELGGLTKVAAETATER